MDELVKLVSKKAGLSEKQAEAAVRTVLDFIKQKLPTSIANQLDNILESGEDNQDPISGLGSLFGK